ncbi:helix-turn-helix domain-containing protein [Streptomyces manipurensis]|uniref:helix-turn-helix domain-containing protein n=1 Tax=Streptomyces manipurensis TaxID=1077945 RepID=UPI003C6FEE02
MTFPASAACTLRRILISPVCGSTARRNHLHVNSVHYRIGRVELLTGRDLSRLDRTLDLYAALRCG